MKPKQIPKIKPKNKPKIKTKKTRESMKLSIFRYKITVLFVILTLTLIVVVSVYEKKNKNFQIYLNGNKTEYASELKEGIEYLPLSTVKALDAFTYYNEVDQEDTIVMPNNVYYTVNYVTKSITKGDSGEKIDATFGGDGLENVIVSLDDIIKMGNYDVITDEIDKTVFIDNNQEFHISEKLEKQAQYNYFRYDLLDKYVEYSVDNPDMQSLDVIIAVNQGLYRPFYTDTTEVENPNDYSVLVNKYFYLPNTYAPIDLIGNNDGVYLRQNAFGAFEELKKDMAKMGYELHLFSGYRSYSRQNVLYNNYVNREGVREADTYSARAGHSEHQTGLAMDFLHTNNINGNFTDIGFEETTEYKWIVQNAYKYGLILRYPEGEEDVTGYIYEPWHWRYVGEDVAQFMYDNGIKTLEEFHALKGGVDSKFPELEKNVDQGVIYEQKFTINDRMEVIKGYEINGLIYYNIYDISKFLNDTKYQYKVVYEPTTGIVNFIKSIGSGIDKNDTIDDPELVYYNVSDIDVFVDNYKVEPQYTIYNINGDFYMELVDICEKLGITLLWDYETNSFIF